MMTGWQKVERWDVHKVASCTRSPSSPGNSCLCSRRRARALRECGAEAGGGREEGEKGGRTVINPDTDEGKRGSPRNNACIVSYRMRRKKGEMGGCHKTLALSVYE